jgi:hypothetical protein
MQRFVPVEALFKGRFTKGPGGMKNRLGLFYFERRKKDQCLLLNASHRRSAYWTVNV